MTGTAAILLAAGKSLRMGSCKQLLPLGGGTVIGRCLDALVGGGAGEMVVVVSGEEQGVVAAVRDYPARIAVNPERGGDMASSVRAGRDALTSTARGVIVFPCDYPLVSAGTVAGLIAAHGEAPDSVIIPCHQGRRGHPLLFPRVILDELEHGMTLRDLVRRAPERSRTFDADDPGVLLDMDTPEDYRCIRSMMEHRQ